MKICLVPYPILDNNGSHAIDQIKGHPYLPLGLLMLGSLLEQAGHEVSLLDPTWETAEGSSTQSAFYDPSHVARLLQAKSPDLVGFSTICSSYSLIVRWAQSLRNLSPKIPILFGGPQATATDEQTLQVFPWIDYILRGEVENSILPLVNCLQSGGNLASVPGLTWRAGKKVIRNPDAPVVDDLDALPGLAYHLYPIERSIKAGLGSTYSPLRLEAGRGCPFNCSFCSTSSYFKRHYRAKSIERLVHEMVSLHMEYGIESFDLTHDLFTLNSDYVLHFCRCLREKGVHQTLKWLCNSRIDTVDQAILAEMGASGCNGILYGIETGSQKMQGLIGKNLQIQKAKSIVKETLSNNIQAITTFICGYPQERPEDLSATLALAMDLISMGASVQLNMLIPLSGSRLFRTFKDTLRHDGQWLDGSGRRLTEEEQQLVLGWPNIFSSSHHFETPYLDYNVIRVLSIVFTRYPRLFTALSVSGIDPMPIVECWPEWFHSRKIPTSEYYYRQSKFPLDFLHFLEEMLDTKALMTPELNELIRYYFLVERVASGPEDAPIAFERFSCDILELEKYLIHNKPLIPESLTVTTYLSWKINGRVITKRLSSSLAELLGMPYP